MNKAKYIVTFSILLLVSYTLQACSSFFFNSNSKILAKNFDWYSGDGFLIKNLRNQKKIAYGFRGENVAEWVSKFGSVTFNQIGKEFPYGGMNEAGLVVEQLWFSQSEYPNNKNAEISELEWIQFQLDNFATVDQVIDNLNKLTIRPIATVHYILADNNGVSVVIEFVNGEAIISKNTSKSQVVTNQSIEKSNLYFNLNPDINLKSRTHLDRFCILKNSIKSVQEIKPITAFETLNLVSENRDNYKTFWKIVYDIDNQKIYISSFKNPKIKTISLSNFNFGETVKYCDINLDKFDFNEYSAQANFILFENAMKMMQLKVDLKLANKHQMNPNEIDVDSVYSKNYTDLVVNFKTKNDKGTIYYSFINGAENFKSYKGFKMGTIAIESKNVRKVFYGFPKTEFALACYQDLNNDGRMEKNILGIPTKTGFSNNKKKIFGIPPNYGTAKIKLDKPTEINVRIK